MNIISTVKVKLQSSGREAVYDSSTSLSLPTLHRTPPPLPPSGLNPGHCQKVKNPRLIYWGKGEAEVCCNIFPCFLYSFITVEPNHNLTKAAQSFSPKLPVVVISIAVSQGLQADKTATVLFQQGSICMEAPYVISLD